MKVSGFLLTAIALIYLYLWRTQQLAVVTPAGVPQPLVTPEHRLAQAAP